jgi:lipoprotein-anchoring transpeptidase ErfK/SrfK
MVALIAGLMIYDAARAGRIAEGVRVGGIDVGGLGDRQARQRLRVRLPARFEPVVVEYSSRRLALEPAEASARLDLEAAVEQAVRRSRRGNPLGRALHDLSGGELRADIAPVVRYSRTAVRSFVGRVAQQIDRPARDADIDFVGYRLRRRHARSGLIVRRGELTRAVTSRLESLRAGPPIPAPVTVTERPDVSLEELADRYPRVITISRRRKALRLYRRLRLVESYRIAVGGVGNRTPAGRYEIRSKVVNPPWTAPNESWAGELAGKTIPPGDPRNPLKARWMEFHDGAGIHGTDDIESLGSAASHGCIRMSIPDVEQLYRKVRVGTAVYIA